MTTPTEAAERLKAALLAHAEAETPVAKENAKKAALEALGEAVEARDAQRRTDRMEAMIQESFARAGVEYRRPTKPPTTFQKSFQKSFDESLPNLRGITANERTAIAEIKDSFDRLSRLKWPA